MTVALVYVFTLLFYYKSLSRTLEAFPVPSGGGPSASCWADLFHCTQKLHGAVAQSGKSHRSRIKSQLPIYWLCALHSKMERCTYGCYAATRVKGTCVFV